jgi:D-alanyl-lipoteichoic acid acyltransferase DltB (MBOAT superfamily)
MVNFRQPYLAESLQDFWRRWHISLSTWLRDYLYIPLGGNRRGEIRTYINLFTTMLLGGLWHGANWTFVAWGGIHGAGLAIGRLFRPNTAERERGVIGCWVRRTIVFHLVCLAWIFFRAESIREAGGMLASLTVWHWQPEYAAALRFLAVFVVPMLLLDLQLEKTGGEYLLEARPLSWRFGAGLAMFMILAFFSANQANAFIYFQF